MRLSTLVLLAVLPPSPPLRPSPPTTTRCNADSCSTRAAARCWARTPWWCATARSSEVVAGQCRDRPALRAHRPLRPHLHAGLDRPARAPGQPVQPAELLRRLPPRRRRLRLPLGRLSPRRPCWPASPACATSAARSARTCATRSTRAWCDGPRICAAGKSIATTGGHADPTNGYNDAAVAPDRPAGPDRRRDQLDRRRAPGRAPALQGRQRRDQDHRHRRRAVATPSPATRRSSPSRRSRRSSTPPRTTATASPRTRTARKA